MSDFMAKCTKFDFGWGSAPDPTGGAYSAPPDLLAGFELLLDLRGPTSLPNCLLLTHITLCQRVRRVIVSSTIGCANFGPDWPLLFKVHEI